MTTGYYREICEKMSTQIRVGDMKEKTFSRTYESAFRGSDAVEWLIRSCICSEPEDAEQMLNTMMRRGLLHHVALRSVFENRSSKLYRFPEDHFRLMLTAARTKGGRQSGHGSKGLPWYKCIVDIAREDVAQLYVRLMLELGKLNICTHKRGVMSYPKSFEGRSLAQWLVESGGPLAQENPVGVGNALLREGIFHHVSLSKPFLGFDRTLYRMAQDQHALSSNRGFMNKQEFDDDMGEEMERGSLEDSFEAGMIAGLNQGGVVAVDPEAAPVQLVTLSRYWTSYRASKLYTVNVMVLEGFLDMSMDWSHELDETFSTFCVVSVADQNATKSLVAKKSLNPQWFFESTFKDVEFLDKIRIELRAAKIGSSILLGWVEFEAHDVMGCSKPFVVEFTCPGGRYVESAAGICKVQFDPTVAAHTDLAEKLQVQILRKQRQIQIDQVEERISAEIFKKFQEEGGAGAAPAALAKSASMRMPRRQRFSLSSSDHRGRPGSFILGSRSGASMRPPKSVSSQRAHSVDSASQLNEAGRDIGTSGHSRASRSGIFVDKPATSSPLGAPVWLSVHGDYAVVQIDDLEGDLTSAGGPHPSAFRSLGPRSSFTSSQFNPPYLIREHNSSCGEESNDLERSDLL